MNIAIIYHDADFDGKLSNEVCRFHLGRIYPHAAIHSYGWDYGRSIPEVAHNLCDENNNPVGPQAWSEYDFIYIVDLSVDELMVRQELKKKIVWIDHHKSAIEKWDHIGDANKLVGYRIDGVAACRLCWQWLSSDNGPHGDPRIHAADVFLPFKDHYVNRAVSEPDLIRLAGEYDIWDHRDPDTKALQFGLRACTDSELANLIDTQFRMTPEGDGWLVNVVAGGRMIKFYCDKQNDEYSRDYAHTIKLEGLTFCALNIGQRGNSDLVRGGIKPEHDAIFAWRYTGKEVLVSLYHIEGKTHHDLSLIAVKYGGGGHKGACGFRTTLAKLEEWFK